jgi:hypothetical protein
MMRIVHQTFAEENAVAALRTDFRTMSGTVTDEATTCNEEQICIMLRQSGKSVEGDTINSHEDQSRETRPLIEFNPVGVVIVRDDSLNYFHTLCSPYILPVQSQKNHYGSLRTIGQKGRGE